MSERPLNSTATSLLGFLADGPMTGWDLVAAAQHLIGPFWTLTRSQVYRELLTLCEGGLIKAGPLGPRDRRPYTLTEAGRTAFLEWINREPGPETIRFPLLVTIGFGRHLAPERLASFVANHRRLHAKTLHHYETLCADPLGDAAVDEYALATLAFGLSYERAVLSWFDSLPEAIRGADIVPPSSSQVPSRPRTTR